MIGSTTPAIEALNLVKHFHTKSAGLVRAVDDVSFTVGRGEIFGLLGPNGAGKTSIVRMLTTITRPTSGSARLMGRDVIDDPLGVRKQIAVVLQETAVEMFLSVRDNLRIYGRLHHLPCAEIRARSARVVEQFGLEEKLGEKMQDLSVGLRRRLQVAKVFMVDSPIVFLDEATTGMDPIIKRKTLEAIRAEAERGRTVFLTTQALHEAEELCDHLLIMNRGKAIASGNLPALRQLATRMFRVSVTLTKADEKSIEALRTLSPLSITVDHHTIEMTFNGEESTILQRLAVLSEGTRIERFEIRGADLEDIFLELLKSDHGGRAPY